MEEKITESEIRRIEFFALQTMVKCCIHTMAQQSGDPEAFARDLGILFENSVENFAFTGASPLKAEVAKELMQQFGAEWISASARQTPPEP